VDCEDLKCLSENPEEKRVGEFNAHDALRPGYRDSSCFR